mgnify:CR=1 FL=1
MKDFYDGFDEEPQIDLTPLIDCLFMLIIFFVLTMSFSKPVLDIVLPQAERSVTEMRQDEILFSVKEDGTFWLDGAPSSLEALKLRLEAEPAKRLNIYMDERAPFSRFVAVVDVAKALRDGRFVISTAASAKEAS